MTPEEAAPPPRETAPARTPWSPEDDARLRAALGALVAALRDVWREPEFLQYRWSSGSDRPVVTTRATSDAAPRLPLTRRLVRGHPGVEVDVTTVSSVPAASSAAAWIDHAMSSQGVPSWGTPPPPSPAWARMIAARDVASDSVLRTGRLGVRVACGVGRRIDPVDQVQAQLREAPREAFGIMARLALEEELTQCAEALGLRTADDCRAFDQVDAMTEALSARLARLASQEVFRYQALAYFNGPPLDTDAPVVLFPEGVVYDAEGPVPIWAPRLALVAATDTHLEHALAASYQPRELPVGMDRCNLVLEIDFELPTSAPPGRFYDLYPNGVRLAEAVLEALRLLRPEDLGMSHFTIRSTAPHTPWAATGQWVDAGARASEWTPRRAAYAPVPPAPLTSDDAAVLPLLCEHAVWPPEVRGLAIARRRFRDAYERYAADDPERLLEHAITLEAVLLNDQGSKGELQFRLAVRAARLLGRDLTERREIALTVRDLYDARSRLAHGAALASGGGKAAAAERVASTLARAAALTRRVLRHVMEGGLPAESDREALSEWWKNQEFG